MNTLRKSKSLAIFGILAVALAVTLVAAPSADAGCHGYRYTTYHAPIVKHYVAPVKYVAPIYTPTYFAPSCYGPTCYGPTYATPTFNYGYGW